MDILRFYIDTIIKNDDIAHAIIRRLCKIHNRGITTMTISIHGIVYYYYKYNLCIRVLYLTSKRQMFVKVSYLWLWKI